MPLEVAREARKYHYVHIMSNFVPLTQVSRWKQATKDIFTNYVEMISNYVQIICNYVEIPLSCITQRLSVKSTNY